MLGLYLAPMAQQYRVKVYNVEAGLAQSQVTSLLQDRQGYIWMGTAGGGVSRFDGISFTNFNVDQGLSGGEISSMVEDKEGRIWFAANGAGISIYDGFSFKSIGEREGLKFTVAKSLFLSSDGSVWLSTDGEGLFRFHKGEIRQFGIAEGLASDTVISIAELPSGQLWAGTKRGISQFQDGVFKPLDTARFSNQPKGNIGAMRLLRDGRLIGANGTRIWMLDGFNFENDTIDKPIDAIVDILEDSDGQIWIAGTYLAARGSFKNFHRIDGTAGFNESGSYCLIEDRNRNIWMGTEYGGALKFSREAFVQYGEGTPFLDRAVFGLMEIEPNVIWVGTEQGLFQLKDGKVTEVEDFPARESFIYQMDRTPTGDVVIITNSKTFLYRNGKFSTVGVAKKDNSYIRSILTKKPSGEIVVSSANRIFEIKGDSAIPFFIPGLENQKGAFYYSESKKGEVWIATMYSGIFKVENGGVKQFGIDDGLPSNRILGLTRDKNDVLWLATYEGLARVKDDEICYYSHREGMNSSLVYIVLADPNGDLWAGTSNGLSRIQLNENSDPVNIRNYGATEGFTGIECNQNAGLVDHQNRLWFGNIGGLAVYDPQRDLPDTIPPQIQLRNVLINMEAPNWKQRGVDQRAWDQIPINPILSYNENEIRIEFSGVTHRLPERVKYRFMLEGHQEDFGPYTADNHATYTLLPPGDYTFKVHAVNAAGIESPVAASFSFTITAPWYRTIWFGIAVFAALLFLVIGIIQIRTRTFHRQRLILEQKVRQRTEALELASKVKSEFLANMSHEIRTPMNGVIGMTDLLQRTPLSAQQRKFVDNIRLSGQNLLALINDILDFSRIESGKLELEEIPFEIRHCMEEVFDTMAFPAFSKGLELLYWVDPEIRGPIIGDSARFKQILINLIGNAIKFTSAGEITVKAKLVKVSDGKAIIQFSVKDTGIGIPKSKHLSLFESFTQVDASTTRKYGGTGLGLAISYNLARIMGGEMWLESEEGIGTTFFFDIVAGISDPWKYDGEHHPARSLEGKKVVLAIRNEAAKNVLADYLNHWKVQFSAFSELEIATDAALDDPQIDLLLIDLRLVHGDPKEFAQKFRKVCEHRNLHFALLAEADIALMLQNQVGENGWVISKPFKRDELLEVLTRKRLTDGDLVFAEEVELLAQRVPLNILVAEDNPINQDVVLGMLASLGYSPQLAVNGQEALDKVLGGNVDLVFMDVQMPVMDGITATLKIHEQLSGKDVPIIVAMTANAMHSDREACLNAGMDSFVSKPFLMDELRQVLTAAPIIRTQGKFHQTSQESKDHKEAAAKTEAVSPEKEISASLTSMQMLEDVSNGDPTFIKGILSKMLVKLPEAIDELKTALEAEDWETVRATSHRSKSSAAYTGAEILKTKFMELEHIARDRSALEEVGPRIQELDELVVRVLDEIKLHLAEY